MLTLSKGAQGQRYISIFDRRGQAITMLQFYTGSILRIIQGFLEHTAQGGRQVFAGKKGTLYFVGKYRGSISSPRVSK